MSTEAKETKSEQTAANPPPPEVVIAPPALYLQLAADELKKDNVKVSAQNVYDKPNGAYTGEISVAQLKDSGIEWTILGHSERRTILGETDDVVASKTKFAIDGGVSVVWCCGESLEERESGNTISVIERQLAALAAKISGDDWKKIVVAYEPIWAIGTGKVASVQQAQEVHAAIRKWLKAKVSDAVADETRILYGGSVNGKNCKDLAKEADIDGFLVGGASLKPECELLLAADLYRMTADLIQSSTSSTPTCELLRRDKQKQAQAHQAHPGILGPAKKPGTGTNWRGYRDEQES
jgi:triosephosphate isomerase